MSRPAAPATPLPLKTFTRTWAAGMGCGTVEVVVDVVVVVTGAEVVVVELGAAASVVVVDWTVVEVLVVGGEAVVVGGETVVVVSESLSPLLQAATIKATMFQLSSNCVPTMLCSLWSHMI